MLASSTKGRIRSLNDALRQNPAQGHVMLTAGVVARGPELLPAIMDAVARFSAFDAANDPHDEHDFGALVVGDARLFFKIDTYDQAFAFHSPDPADPAVTTRVLTIMLAEEY